MSSLSLIYSYYLLCFALDTLTQILIMPPGRPRKRPLEENEKEEEVQVFDIVSPMKKTRHQGETPSSGSHSNKESSPVLRRSTRRRTLVEEIKDMTPGLSSVFNTPPSTSSKPRKKPGRLSKVTEAAKTKVPPRTSLSTRI